MAPKDTPVRPAASRQDDTLSYPPEDPFGLQGLRWQEALEPGNDHASDVEREPGRAAAGANHGPLLRKGEPAGKLDPKGIEREIDVEEKEPQ